MRTVGGDGVRRRMTHRAGRPVIDPDRIGAAALTVLRHHGLAGVTMAAVARELGVSVRAIYHYVPDRDAVLAEAARRWQRRLAPPPHTDDWRADLTAYATALRANLAAHPGVLEIALQAGVVGTDENFYVVQEATLARLTAMGLDPRRAWLAMAELVRFVAGFALMVERIHPDIDQASLVEQNAAHTSGSPGYPLSALAAAASVGPDDQFAFGLDLLLDGLGRLADPGSPSPVPDRPTG